MTEQQDIKTRALHPIFIWGAGDFGREYLASYLMWPQHKWYFQFIAFVDDDEKKWGTLVDQYPVFNPDVAIEQEAYFIVAIGNPQARREVVQNLTLWKRNFFSLVRDNTTSLNIYTRKYGIGCFFMGNCIIATGVTIGEHVSLNPGCIIEHDSIVGDYCNLGPNVTLCGHVTVGEATFIGASVTVLPGVTIGKNCYINAGTIIKKDVPDGTKVRCHNYEVEVEDWEI